MTRNSRRTGRRMPRAPRQRRGQRIAGASNSKVFTNRIAQPLPVAADLITMRRFEAYVFSSGSGPFTVSTQDLVNTLPGQTTVWDKVQFHRFDVFSVADGGSVTVTVNNPASGYFGDVPTGFADGVTGSRKAHVAIALNELYKETWIDSADTSPLLTIHATNGSGSNAIVQFVAVLRSTAGSVPAIEPVPGEANAPFHRGDNS